MPEGGELSESFQSDVKETELQQTLAHEFVASIYSWGTFAGQFLWVLMEWCSEGPLSVFIGDALTHSDRNTWIHQLALGLRHIHSLYVIHRDIKPDNVLIARRDDGTTAAKYIDFGCAKKVQDSELSHYGVSGTPGYMSPELEQRLPYSFGCDIWSLGITYMQVFTGTTQVWDESIGDAVSLVRRLKDAPHSEDKPASLVLPDLSEAAADVLNLVLRTDALRRPTAAELASRIQPMATSSAPSASDRATKVAELEEALTRERAALAAASARSLELQEHLDHARHHTPG